MLRQSQPEMQQKARGLLLQLSASNRQNRIEILALSVQVQHHDDLALKSCGNALPRVRQFHSVKDPIDKNAAAASDHTLAN